MAYHLEMSGMPLDEAVGINCEKGCKVFESKVLERLVYVHLGRFMECSGVLPTTQCLSERSGYL